MLDNARSWTPLGPTDKSNFVELDQDTPETHKNKVFLTTKKKKKTTQSPPELAQNP
jgi:hypothetical protein